MASPSSKAQLPHGPMLRSLWLWKALAGFSLAAVALENYLLSSLTVDGPTLQQNALAPSSSCWFHETRDRFVSPVDLKHLSLLHATCTSGKDPIVSWRYGADGEPDETVLIERHDPRALEELRRCPDVDVYLPGSIRGSGYCEDGCAYTKCASCCRWMRL